MLKTIILAENAIDPSTWEKLEVEDVREFLIKRFEIFPDNARIYHNQVAENCDVTPSDEWGVDRLGKLEGTLYVIVYPKGVTAVVVIVAIIAIAAISYLLRPDIPSISMRNTQSNSPNNALSERKNQPRLNGRIPDIYGTVTSTPDLLAEPYILFENHREVETAYMCVGRGTYEVLEDTVKDDKTPVNDISGVSVEVYAPYTSPNSGDSPQLTIGTPPVAEPLWSTVRSNSVNGQILRAPNSGYVQGTNNIKFKHPNEIHVDPAAEIDFTASFFVGDVFTIANSDYTGSIDGTGVDQTISVRFNSASNRVEFETTATTAFTAGDELIISGAYFILGSDDINLDGTYIIAGVVAGALVLTAPSLVNSDWNLIAPIYSPATVTPYKTVNLKVNGTLLSVNLSGIYEVSFVSSLLIKLDQPNLINADWDDLDQYTNNETSYISPLLQSSIFKWVGPFIVENAEDFFFNFVASNGLYKDSGTNQVSFDVEIEIEITPIDSLGVPTGAAELFEGTIEGSAQTKSLRALTLKTYPTFHGRSKFRARRVTDTDSSFTGTVVDEINWRDAYAVTEVSENDFGNVTTVRAVTLATGAALAVKDRKLNMLVTRKIPQRISGTNFTTTLYATNRADEIISAICLDPKIGNRSVDEIDFDNIYTTIAEIETYFGSELAAEFNYTFDNDNLSFEEIIATVASSVYSNAYRRGNVIKINFEKETDISTLLFNHRNKIPGTETRTVRFGNEGDNDGVEYEYVDSEDDAIITFYLPSDKTAINPKKIESIGIRNKLQAHFHAHRIWNKIQNQNVITEFEATQEADVLVLSDKVLVADNTRPETQDGDVVSQNGLELELSQPVVFVSPQTYNIFLQHTDGTIESIGIIQGSTSYNVVLSNAPKAPLSLDQDAYARATYQIVGSASTREHSFLLTEKEPQTNFTTIVKAINYNSEYYSNDKDLIDDVIDEDGNPV